MVTTIQFLKELLPDIETYLESKGSMDADIDSFTLWLNQRMIKFEHKDHDGIGSHPHREAFHAHVGLDGKLFHSILFLNRFAKLYIKKALADSELVSVEDLHFLLMVNHKKSIKKSELIYSHMLEMPTGIEVINRLLKKGLIEDFTDPDDKRSKRVKMTAKGEELLRKMLEKMGKVATILIGNLSAQQKITFLALIEQLTHYHSKMIKDEKTKSLDELCAMVMKNNSSTSEA